MPRNLSVLLVEDDDPLRNVLGELLRQWGCVVYSTAQGQQAIDFVRKQTIDFSILDMHLPGTTGIDVFRQIKVEMGGILPSILISGEATPEDAKRALDLGMFRFLKKPLDMHNLRQCFDLLIAHHFGSPPDGPLGSPHGSHSPHDPRRGPPRR